MLWTDFLSWDNFYAAFRQASKGKRGRMEVASFEYALEENLLALMEELSTKTYRPGAYRNFIIHEPKRRLISAAPFRDRVVHHALCNVIEPLFERSFISDSYANRAGKGTHRALDRCQYFARKYRYALQMDIRQFFPSIDHDVLRQTLAKTIRDRDILWLVDRILEGGRGVLIEEYEMAWFDGDNLFAVNRSRGLPIGNLTSQFWANCYLNPLDQFVKLELGCKAYVRFVDDLLVFAYDKKYLRQVLAQIEARLARLRLVLHPCAQPRKVSEGIPFLGFCVYPEHRRLKRRNAILFRRRFIGLKRLWQSGRISFESMTDSVRGWCNHAQYGNTIGLRKSIFAPSQGISR